MKTILASVLVAVLVSTRLVMASGSVEYVQTAYPVYKLAGDIAHNAASISVTYLSNTRTIAPDAQLDRTALNTDTMGSKLPAERIKWAKSDGERFAITAKGATNAQCSLAFQDIAHLKTEKGTHPLMVLGYKGCPLSIKHITPMADISIREPVIIDIASINDNLLRTSETSAVPFIVTAEATMPCFMAVNVQWRFAHAGMSFVTETHTYRITKDGATVSFTETGMKLAGVSELPKEIK